MPIPPPSAPSPSRVRALAVLYGLEAAVRGLLLSVVPVEMYRAWGRGETVSALFLMTGVVSLGVGLLVPWVAARVGRRRMAAAGGGLYLVGCALLAWGAAWSVTAAVVANAVAAVTVTVCLAAYVLDNVPRGELPRSESTRLLYSAGAWVVGPFAGVALQAWGRALPFAAAAVFAAVFVAVLVRQVMGDGRGRRSAAVTPLAFLERFAHQPRLIAGWVFASVRSCGWWVYVVYLPLFAIERGLPDTTGGAALSLSNAVLFATPLTARLARWLTVRGAVRAGFAWCATFFVLAWALADAAPWLTVGALVLASLGLALLDVAGGLPFLMAVRPSERSAMAAIYSTYRDVSGILSPLAGGAILLVAGVPWVFAACGAAMAAAWTVAGTVHPRLGRPRGAAG